MRGFWCWSLDGSSGGSGGGGREEFERGIVRVAVVTMVGAAPAPALILVLAAAAVAVAHAENRGDVEALLERLLDGGVVAAVEEGGGGEEELVRARKDRGGREGHEQADPVLARDLAHVPRHVGGLVAGEAAPELFEYRAVRLALVLAGPSRPSGRCWKVLAV